MKSITVRLLCTCGSSSSRIQHSVVIHRNTSATRTQRSSCAIINIIICCVLRSTLFPERDPIIVRMCIFRSDLSQKKRGLSVGVIYGTTHQSKKRGRGAGRRLQAQGAECVSNHNSVHTSPLVITFIAVCRPIPPSPATWRPFRRCTTSTSTRSRSDTPPRK